MSEDIEYCNWSFDEYISSGKWLVKQDCSDTAIVLSRGDNKRWRSYKKSLQPQVQTRYPQPPPGSQCPDCGKQVNGFNPHDDGETWRR